MREGSNESFHLSLAMWHLCVCVRLEVMESWNGRHVMDGQMKFFGREIC